MTKAEAKLRESIKANVNVYWRAFSNGQTAKAERAQRKIRELKKTLTKLKAAS
jgi:hypothetical protein